jgi:hypothetical protein
LKKDYQPRGNLVKDENGDLLADAYNILNRDRYYFFHLLNDNRVSDVRQIEILFIDCILLCFMLCDTLAVNTTS